MALLGKEEKLWELKRISSQEEWRFEEMSECIVCEEFLCAQRVAI